MAVPKKRTSRSKTRIRKNAWKIKAKKIASKALSMAKSVLTNRSKSFYYAIKKELISSSDSLSTNDE